LIYHCQVSSVKDVRCDEHTAVILKGRGATRR